jgi:hypothetical protein
MAGVIAVFGFAAPASGDIYRWRDADGVMRFSNQPPPPGVKVLERIAETPYDAESDRRRMEEDRRVRMEFEKLDLEQRQSAVAAREREAQHKLQEAERRMEQSQPKADPGDECDERYYLRYGSCGPGVVYYRHSGRSGPNDLYQGVYRDNNNLYYQKPAPHGPKPKGEKPPSNDPARPKPGKPAPGAKSGKTAAAAGDLEQPAPTAPKASPGKR